MSDVSGGGLRVSLWHCPGLFRHCSCTVPGTVPAPALHGPYGLNTSAYALVDTGVVRAPGTVPCPVHPGYTTPAPALSHPVTCTSVPYAGAAGWAVGLTLGCTSGQTCR